MKDIHEYTEYVLALSKFKEQETVRGLDAVARLLQNLLELEPNTYPHHPDMGIGIGRYMFEPLDAATIFDIKSHISKQVKQYLPDIDVIEITIEPLKHKATNNTTLGILFRIGPYGNESNLGFVYEPTGKAGSSSYKTKVLM